MITTTQEPKYSVELIVDGKKRYYLVDEVEQYGGVTSTLDIVGGGKTHGLKKWATNVALANVEKELMAIGHEPIVVDPPLIKDIIDRARKRPAEILDDAAGYGTSAHLAFDRIVKGEPLGDLPDAIMNSILAFKDWFSSSGIEVVMGDTPVASKKYRYGGKLDAVGMKNGEWGILDWKCSNGTWPEYALQVAAYAMAFRETYGPTPTWAAIVRFGKTTPDYEVSWIADLEVSAKAFLSAKALKDALSIPQFTEAK